MMALRFLLLLPLALVRGQTVQVDGSGTTNPSKFFWKLMEMMQVGSNMHSSADYLVVGLFRTRNGQESREHVRCCPMALGN